ncbi:hypothetical protein F1880_007852 [Penicillium rolfsii]|nr:hypothetical protein F1880_007852 [Penicillium rolfsii]
MAKIRKRYGLRKGKTVMDDEKAAGPDDTHIEKVEPSLSRNHNGTRNAIFSTGLQVGFVLMV